MLASGVLIWFGSKQGKRSIADAVAQLRAGSAVRPAKLSGCEAGRRRV
jgi:hypothetical protein